MDEISGVLDDIVDIAVIAFALALAAMAQSGGALHIALGAVKDRSR
jgi:hypothetical protein